MQHNVRDPNRDHDYGRVYREATYKGRPLQSPVAIAGASLDALMKNLEHPVDGVRYRTRIELSGRPTAGGGSGSAALDRAVGSKEC